MISTQLLPNCISYVEPSDYVMQHTIIPAQNKKKKNSIKLGETN